MNREWNPAHFFRQSSRSSVDTVARIAEVAPPRSGQSALAWWQELTTEDRARVEPLVYLVNEFCSAKGRPYLQALARQVWRGDPRLRTLKDWSSPDLGMTLLAEAEGPFHAMRHTFSIDSMERLVEFQGRSAADATLTPEARAGLAQGLSQHFEETCGSGHCFLDAHEDPGHVSMHVWHELDAVPEEQFEEDGTLTTSLRRQVTRLQVVFQKAAGLLLIKAPREVHRVALRRLCGTALFGDSGYFERSTKPRFQLDRLAAPDFEFPPSPVHGIEEVGIVRIELVPADFELSSVQLRFKVPSPLSVVRERVLASHNFELGDCDVLKLSLRFRFAGAGRSGIRTVVLEWPNGSNLNDAPRDWVIRDYLKEVGLYAFGDSVADNA